MPQEFYRLVENFAERVPGIVIAIRPRKHDHTKFHRAESPLKNILAQPSKAIAGASNRTCPRCGEAIPQNSRIISRVKLNLTAAPTKSICVSPAGRINLLSSDRKQVDRVFVQKSLKEGVRHDTRSLDRARGRGHELSCVVPNLTGPNVRPRRQPGLQRLQQNSSPSQSRTALHRLHGCMGREAL